MINAYTAADFRQADEIAMTHYGIPGAVLMENAGRGACEVLLKRYPEANDFLILCGPGNNGGDGFVIARHLALNGRRVFIITSAAPETYRSDAAVNCNSAFKLGLRIRTSSDMSDDEIKQAVCDSSVVIDALLGTGTTGAPRGEVLRLVLASLNAKQAAAVDIPSGVDADTGEIPGLSVKADVTISFSAAKNGLYITPGASVAGEIALCPIGIAPELILPQTPSVSIINRKDLKRFLPTLSLEAYKGTRGALLIIGGSDNYRGAPLLAALGALRSGCGLVVLAIPDFMADSAAAFLPEAIIEPIPSDGETMDLNRLDAIAQKWAHTCKAAVIGPGLKRKTEDDSAFKYFWRNWRKPLLADAGAFDFLANIPNLPKRADSVITPHAGEAALLLCTTAEEIMSRRLRSCRQLSDDFGVAVLKGRNTLVSDKDHVTIIDEGSPALATAGSGDVLSGAIGALLAAGCSPIEAACGGALLHATAGSLLMERGKESGVLAREIADTMSECIHNTAALI